MSNYLAFANVTEALRLRLETEVKHIIANAVATAFRPDAVPADATSVNIFLYQIVPNAALRNGDLPTRDSDATLLQGPRAAFDLHYLLTVHGKDNTYDPQQILGGVVRTLHGQPMLTRSEISAAATHLAAPLPSDLADAVEAVRFTPLPLSLEELSKLWSVFFQVKYALSVAYQASVVVIEGSDTPRPALPVRSANIVVRPSLGPVIDRIANEEPILADSTLRIVGRNLRGDTTDLRVNDTLVRPTPISDNEITLDLHKVSLQAGIATVQVVQGPHPGFESNRVPFVLAPSISSLTTTPAPVTMNVDPQVKKGQRLVLALNGAKAYSFTATAAADATAITIPIANVDAGTYLVRLQVDGAESPLQVDSAGHYNGPQVAIP